MDIYNKLIYKFYCIKRYKNKNMSCPKFCVPSVTLTAPRLLLHLVEALFVLAVVWYWKTLTSPSRLSLFYHLCINYGMCQLEMSPLSWSSHIDNWENIIINQFMAIVQTFTWMSQPLSDNMWIHQFTKCGKHRMFPPSHVPSVTIHIATEGTHWSKGLSIF